MFRSNRVPRKSIGLLLVVVASISQCLLLANLVVYQEMTVPPLLWLGVHVTLCAALAVGAGWVLSDLVKEPSADWRFHGLLFALAVFIPVIGSAGVFIALYRGFVEAGLRHREPDFWQLTPRAELPFTTPRGRKPTEVDARGFTEHLMYSHNDDDLYRKVLSAANIRTSLSVSALKQAMRHSDERIRLTAYKTLDRKVTALNQQIQSLELAVSKGDTKESSNSWLQIASNYWELLTLEKGEPVARQQLLNKASAAAIQAVVVLPINRNAHFILGRVSLLQGDTRRAKVAFERAMALGMPADKTLPYLAETAYMQKDYRGVQKLLLALDPAARAYPPLSHVAEYWA